MERSVVAVSGSRGFLGEHLIQRLSSEKVIRLDRSGEVPYCNTVIDLAGYGNLYGQNDISEIYKANLTRVIKSVENAGGAKYIYVSTSSVKLPFQTPYSLSKKASEEFLQSIGKKIAIVRPFTIIGTGEQEEHLIPKLIQSCLYGTEIPFVSDPVHDFCDVDDFVDALLTVKDKGLFRGEIYEVGSGRQTSNDEVRLLVEDITGNKANIRPVESLRNYDTKDWVANNERICSLGWKPKVSLEQGIKRMIEVYEKN